MRPYAETIEQTRIVQDVRSCTTTGDLEYSGTAFEISDEAGRELFHVVVDKKGERQLLFFPSSDGYRMPVEVMERILAKAKAAVTAIDDRENSA